MKFSQKQVIKDAFSDIIIYLIFLISPVGTHFLFVSSVYYSIELWETELRIEILILQLIGQIGLQIIFIMYTLMCAKTVYDITKVVIDMGKLHNQCLEEVLDEINTF